MSEQEYHNKLNKVLVHQSHNELFYKGDIENGSKILTKEVVDTLNVDRTSIWLYNEDKTSILCHQLYIKSDDSYHTGIELFAKDFSGYFNALLTDPIIIANDAETHPATECFTEPYLKPLGIKSMLDVPVIYKGDMIGVICIESFAPRVWIIEEISFAELLSSLFSFAYSIKEGNALKNFNKVVKEELKKQRKSLKEVEKFIDAAALVSKTDAKGKITYVNKKFTEVSGWSLEEARGKDHYIVNSGVHDSKFWADMYRTTVLEKDIWNSIVTNKAKDGHLYYVDTFIKAEFTDNKLSGFTSIRQDVTKIYESLAELDKKNTYLEHAAKIIRHDMHSGINTYIPRGISSLERRLTEDQIKELKIEMPLKMIKEGLIHTQKVYKGVYEFTNLVKADSELHKEKVNIKNILYSYLKTTSYLGQVELHDLIDFEVNEALFCTAVDNLIRNGLKYNDSDAKKVEIYMDNEMTLAIQDNGRGLTQEEFEALSKPYARKKDQKESGSGLGLNICVAILKEHGFSVSCEKNNIGTKIKIKLNP